MNAAAFVSGLIGFPAAANLTPNGHQEQDGGGATEEGEEGVLDVAAGPVRDSLPV